MCLLMSRVPVFHVQCQVTLCPASRGAHVAWVHGPVAMARSQPGAFHPGQQGHLLQPTTAASGPQPGLTATPGATCPLLLPPLALIGPWALPPPGTGWHPPLSGPPSQGRINRILSQPPVPVWAHLWDNNGRASAESRPTASPEDSGRSTGKEGSRQAGG